jgi:hypothetical protein
VHSTVGKGDARVIGRSGEGHRRSGHQGRVAGREGERERNGTETPRGAHHATGAPRRGGGGAPGGAVTGGEQGKKGGDRGFEGG